MRKPSMSYGRTGALVLTTSLLLAACTSLEPKNNTSALPDQEAKEARPRQQQVPADQRPLRVRPSRIPPVKTVPVAPPIVTDTPATHIGTDPEKKKKLKVSDPPPKPGVRKRGRGVAVARAPLSAPVAPGSEPDPLAAAPAATDFDSTDFDDNATFNSGYVFIPPDPHAAVGPDHLVNVVNATLAIHQKDGTLLLQQSLQSFFSSLPSPPLTFTFDPKVIYDQYAERFLVVTLEQTDIAAGDADNTSRIFVGVSQTSDPTGSWNVMAIDANSGTGLADHWADYPGFAVDEEAVYITNNMFPFGTAFPNFAVRLWVIDKGLGSSGFYEGGTPIVSVLNPYGGGGIATTTQPAHTFGTVPTDVGTFLVSYSGLTDGTDEYLQTLRIDNPLSSPTFTHQYLNIGNIEKFSGKFPNAPQLNLGGAPPQDIETNDRRALNAVWRNGSLWMTTTIKPPSSGPDPGQATAYWAQMATCDPGSTCTTVPVVSLTDQGSIGGEDIAAGTHTFMSSIAVNGAEDVVVGFSASGPAIHPGSYYATRQIGDPAGTFGPSQTLRAGLDEYERTFGGTRNRWGDYSGAAVDPSNNCLWVYNEHAIAGGTAIGGEDGRWGTAYAPVCQCAAPLQASQWKQLALACDPGSANTVQDVFGNDLNAGNYNVTWVVWGRDATADTYQKLGLTDTVAVGRGYWVLTSDSGRYVGVGGGFSGDPVDIPLVSNASGRLNMVGHPHTNSVDWQEVRVIDGPNTLTLSQADPSGTCDTTPAPECVMSRVGYKWTGSAYESFDGVTLGMEGVLNAFDGIWARAYKSGIALRIPKTTGGGASVLGSPVGTIAGGSVSTATGTHSSATAALSSTTTNQFSLGAEGESHDGLSSATPIGNGDWYVRLIVESGGLKDQGNVLGQLSDSIDGQDRHDLKELDPFGNTYLSIVFPHQEWSQAPGFYTSDFHGPSRRPGGAWHFAVRAANLNDYVTLRWEGPAAILRHARLIDEATGKHIKVGKSGSYTFSMTESLRDFRFVVGKAGKYKRRYKSHKVFPVER